MEAMVWRLSDDEVKSGNTGQGSDHVAACTLAFRRGRLRSYYSFTPSFFRSIHETPVSTTSFSNITTPTIPLLSRIDQLHLPHFLY